MPLKMDQAELTAFLLREVPQVSADFAIEPSSVVKQNLQRKRFWRLLKKPWAWMHPVFHPILPGCFLKNTLNRIVLATIQVL